MSIVLKVMAGDRLDIWGKSYYFENVTNGATNNKSIPTLAILEGLLAGPPAASPRQRMAVSRVHN